MNEESAERGIYDQVIRIGSDEREAKATFDRAVAMAGVGKNVHDIYQVLSMSKSVK
jgi:hypothetical protein